jgi:AraC-like DNA-binding protein
MTSGNIDRGPYLPARAVREMKLAHGQCNKPFATSRRETLQLQTWRLRRVQKYIRSHISLAIKLKDLADAAGLTPMYFAAQFRARTGLRPHEYVMQQRVARAQVLLREPGSEIADIACSVGFANQAHFTTMFRRHLGITPHRWRVSQDLDISRFRPGNRSSEPQYSSAHYCVPPTKSAVDR